VAHPVHSVAMVIVVVVIADQTAAIPTETLGSAVITQGRRCDSFLTTL
jgi:hypothetical protein